MSFHIGSSSSGAKYSTSTKERIILYSEAESNMFVLRSHTLPGMYMTFQGSNDTQMSFGAEGNFLRLLDNNKYIASFSSNASYVYGSLNTTTLNTSNIFVNFSGDTRASMIPFLLASNVASQTQVLSAMPNGDFSIAGLFHASQVNTQILSVSNIYSTSTNSNINVNGDLNVTGKISGSLNLGSLTDTIDAAVGKKIGSNIASSSLSLSNTVPLDTAMLTLSYTQFSEKSLSNVIDITIYSNCTYPAMSMDAYGRLVVGSNTINNNAGIATLYYSSNFQASNILVIAGDSNQTVVVNNIGNIGIGTSVPYNKLTLFQDDTDITLQPMIGMYSYYSNVIPQNFIVGYSSNTPYTKQPVFFITNTGDIHGISVSTPTLSASNIYSSSIHTYSPTDSNISFNNNNLSNINNVYADNVYADNVTVKTFQVLNYVIKGTSMDTVNFTYFDISYSNIWFNSTKFTISPNKDDKTLQPRGMLLVRTEPQNSPSYMTGTSSAGLTVIGTSYDSIQVISAVKPSIELSGKICRTYLSQDSTDGTFYISHAGTSSITPSIAETSDINSAGIKITPSSLSPSTPQQVHINNFMTVGTVVGIGFSSVGKLVNPILPYSLQVKSITSGGGLLVLVDPSSTSTTSSQYSFVVRYNTTTLGGGGYIGVGIGTDAPSSSLDVNGTIKSKEIQVNGTISATGNISSSSDVRKKTNLVQIQNPLEKIAQLTGYTYTKINGPVDGNANAKGNGQGTGNGNGVRESGLIAQDVLRVLPEIVDMDAQTKLYSIAYGNMAGLFVEAFKEMQARIDVLESKLASLSSSTSS